MVGPTGFEPATPSTPRGFMMGYKGTSNLRFQLTVFST